MKNMLPSVKKRHGSKSNCTELDPTWAQNHLRLLTVSSGLVLRHSGKAAESLVVTGLVVTRTLKCHAQSERLCQRLQSKCEKQFLAKRRQPKAHGASKLEGVKHKPKTPQH